MIKKIITSIKEIDLWRKLFLFYIIIYTILAALEGFFNGLSAAIILPFFLGFLSESKSVFFHNTFKWLPDIGISLSVSGAILVSLYALKIFFTFLQNIMNIYIQQTLLMNIKKRKVKSIFSVPLQAIEKQRVGKIVQFINYDSHYAATTIGSLSSMINKIIIIISALCVAFMINYKMTFYVLLLYIGVAFVLKTIFKKVEKYSRIALNYRNQISTTITEKLHNIRFVKSIGYELNEYLNLCKDLHSYKRTEIQGGKWGAFGKLLPEILMLVFFIIIVVFLNSTFIEFSVITTQLLPILMIINRLNSPVSGLNYNWISIKNTYPSLEMFVNDLEANKSVESYDFLNDTTIQKSQITGIKSIQLDNIVFYYDQLCIINDFSLKIQKGTPIIIRGPSGSGKSTIAHLIRGLIKPQKGNIFINKISIDKLNRNDYSNKIGYATQDSCVFHGTIRNNLTYGLANNIPDKDIWEALKKTSANDFVENLHDGLDAVISESGSSLSGGQKQLLALTRILLRNPEIIILDEITSGVDIEKRQVIKNLLSELKNDKILLIITHDIRFKIDHALVIELTKKELQKKY